MKTLQSDWLSYSYTVSHYSSPLNFPLLSLFKLITWYDLARAPSVNRMPQNALGRLSDDSARSAEVARQRQLSPTFFQNKMKRIYRQMSILFRRE